MDRISAALLDEFAKEFGLTGLKPSEQFENFASYLVTRKHYSEAAFEPEEIVTGSGNDTGIDAIATIVNNSLVTDKGSIDDLMETNNYLDVAFVFVQAETSSSFDTQKLGNFGEGVVDFFGDANLPRNDLVEEAMSIMNLIYKNSAKFSKGNPSCHLYYVTTGTWVGDANLEARRQAIIKRLMSLRIFSRVDVTPVGADQIQALYSQTKNKIRREFEFDKRTTVAAIKGVKEAHLGHIAAQEFMNLICDEQGEIIESLFYENVRGWHGYNQINAEIRETLETEEKDRFALMNNGITIITREMLVTADHFTISDFQIVNGCQTSHVLYDNRDLLDGSVRIPIRLISTQDDDVMEAIITATNRQTEVKQDQFFARRKFSKKLEAYFTSFDEEERLYYERRAHQYDSQSVERGRIIGHQALVRAIGAIVLQEPHRTTRTYRLLASQVGKEIFKDTDKLEPYYAAACIHYKLEFLFRNRKISPALKPARYHIQLATALMIDQAQLKPLNSNDVGRRSLAIANAIWKDGETLITTAASLVETILGDKIDRDAIRTERTTDDVLAAFGIARPGPRSERPPEIPEVAGGDGE